MSQREEKSTSLGTRLRNVEEGAGVQQNSAPQTWFRNGGVGKAGRLRRGLRLLRCTRGKQRVPIPLLSQGHKDIDSLPL